MAPPEPMPEPVAPESFDDGVDVSLIRWFLEMTPAERLRYAARFAAGVASIRKLQEKAAHEPRGV